MLYNHFFMLSIKVTRKMKMQLYVHFFVFRMKGKDASMNNESENALMFTFYWHGNFGYSM